MNLECNRILTESLDAELMREYMLIGHVRLRLAAAELREPLLAGLGGTLLYFVFFAWMWSFEYMVATFLFSMAMSIMAVHICYQHTVYRWRTLRKYPNHFNLLEDLMRGQEPFALYLRDFSSGRKISSY